MISKNKMKEIHALGLKKFRDAEGLFIAEGPKIVPELLEIFPCTYLAATEDWLKDATPTLLAKAEMVNDATEEELKKASFLQTPQSVLAIFKKPNHGDFSLEQARENLVLALDGVQDPGNMGTILRLADWFGIENVICSMDSADVFSPKVVQASMGAIGRVKTYKADLAAELRKLKGEVPIFGTFLDGDNIHEKELYNHGIIIMGNEGNGIRPETEQLVSERLFIPNYPKGRPTSESLNVAIATAIICEEFRRRTY